MRISFSILLIVIGTNLYGQNALDNSTCVIPEEILLLPQKEKNQSTTNELRDQFNIKNIEDFNNNSYKTENNYNNKVIDHNYYAPQKVINNYYFNLSRETNNQFTKIQIKEPQDINILLEKAIQNEDTTTDKSKKQLYQNEIALLEGLNCIVADNFDKIKYIKDEKGEKVLAVDIDISELENNPNYFYKGEEINGYRVIKKFNKYGYLKTGNNDIDDVTFKYNYAKDYSKTGYAISGDNNYSYILDQNGVKTFQIPNNSIDSIQNLYGKYFIVHKNDNDPFSSKNLCYLINEKGEVASDKYYKITPKDKSHLVLDFEKWVTLEKSSHGEPFTITKRKLELQKQSVLYNTKRILTFKEIKKIAKNCFNFNFSINPEQIQIVAVFGIPNTEEIICLINWGSSHFLVRKDVINEEVKSCFFFDSIENFYSINLLENSDFKNKGLFISVLKKKITKKHVMIFANNSFFHSSSERPFKFTQAKNKDGSLRIGKYIDFRSYKNQIQAYDFFQRKYIGNPCDSISSIDHSKKNILFFDKIYVSNKDQKNTSSYDISYKLGTGLMDFNGLKIIPSIFENINFNNNIIELKDFYNNFFKVDTKGNCLDNCQLYNTIIKKYFTEINEN